MSEGGKESHGGGNGGKKKGGDTGHEEMALLCPAAAWPNHTFCVKTNKQTHTNALYRSARGGHWAE